MSKKLITGCLALFALAAFALPAVASAATPVITHPTGTRLDPSTGSCTSVSGTICITAHNVGETKIRDTANENTLIKCTGATMTGYLTENSGTSIKGNIHTTSFSGTGASGRCTDSFGAAAFVDTNLGNGTPWCLAASGTENKFTVRGNECSKESRSITFVLTDSVVGTCKYSRTGTVNGTFTTHSTGDAILTVAPSTTGSAFAKEEGSVLCPASGLLELSFTLETDNNLTEPLYIS
jgi:hypothetical protein